LKKLVMELVSNSGEITISSEQAAMLKKVYPTSPSLEESRLLSSPTSYQAEVLPKEHSYEHEQVEDVEDHEEVEESLSLEDREKELIQKALDKHHGKRKYAALELGISERTLYRKIKEYDLNG
jgi:transcriptional regulator with PAS, ATPase and Fis domain